jgi:hypothetical protein
MRPNCLEIRWRLLSCFALASHCYPVLEDGRYFVRIEAFNRTLPLEMAIAFAETTHDGVAVPEPIGRHFLQPAPLENKKACSKSAGL